MNTNDLRFAADLLEWLEEQTGEEFTLGKDLHFYSTYSDPIRVDLRPARNSPGIGSDPQLEGIAWYCAVRIHGHGDEAKSDNPREAFKSAIQQFTERWREIRDDVEKKVAQLEGIE